VEAEMAQIHHIFSGISEEELDGALSKSGVLTIKGHDLLRRMGVETGPKLSIGMTTIQNLVILYNEWKRPKTRVHPETELIIGNYIEIPEDDVYLYGKSNELTQFFKMGIKVGEGTKVGETVHIGLGVSIGRYCEISELCDLCIFSTLHDRVHLGKAVFVGKDSDVESGSRIMAKAVIGPRNIVKENSIIPEGSVFNENKKYR
jgi:NDP-sugar pyrophosphorylase family protein